MLDLSWIFPSIVKYTAKDETERHYLRLPTRHWVRIWSSEALEELHGANPDSVIKADDERIQAEAKTARNGG